MKNRREMFINAKLCTHNWHRVHTIQNKDHHNKQQHLKDNTMITSCPCPHLHQLEIIFTKLLTTAQTLEAESL